MIKRIAWILLGLFLVIQLFRPDKNKDNSKSSAAIAHSYPPSAEVQGILQKACNDCHSNNTKYPWYSEVQPIAWWLNDHIEEGKHELNFDSFLSYPLKKQYKKLGEIQEEVKEGKMPLPSYTRLHHEAKLTEGERKALIDWAAAAQKQVGPPKISDAEGTK